ncbi:MAG: UvrD-helicase domain-containing protein [Vicinamibacterales bacterium]
MSNRDVVLTAGSIRDLSNLPRQRQQRVMKALKLLSADYRHPSLGTERVKGTKDRYECRIDDRYRMIITCRDDVVYVLLADDHDDAYRRAPLADAGTLPEVDAPEPIEAGTQLTEVDAADTVRVFDVDDSDALLASGVPSGMLDRVLACSEPEQLIDVGLPDDLTEYLMDVAVSGGRPSYRFAADDLDAVESSDDADTASDAQPWDVTRIQLPPEHRRLVDRQLTGPLLIRGSAGSGKSTVAVRRAIESARRAGPGGQPQVLFLCFNRILAETTRQTLERHCPPGSFEACTVDHWCGRFMERAGHNLTVLPNGDIEGLIRDAIRTVRLTADESEIEFLSWPWQFFHHEILRVIKCRLALHQDAYLRLKRSGRRVGLSEAQRRVVWRVYEEYQHRLRVYDGADWEELGNAVLREFDRQPDRVPRYREVIVDEAQDFTPAKLRISARLAENEQVVYLADAAQSIYRPGFVWKDIGMSMTGRSAELTRNLRQSRAIHRLVRVLGQEIGHQLRELDEEQPPDHNPAFSDGPQPTLVECRTFADQLDYVVERIGTLTRDCGVPPSAIAVICFRNRLLGATRRALTRARVPLASKNVTSPDGVSVVTAHTSKGLEWPIVLVLDANEGVVPPTVLDPRIEDIVTYQRHLFVACSRATDELAIVTTADAQSRFLRNSPVAAVCRKENRL